MWSMWLLGEIEMPVVIRGYGKDPEMVPVYQGKNGDSCGSASSQQPSWAAAADHGDESGLTLLLTGELIRPSLSKANALTEDKGYAVCA